MRSAILEEAPVAVEREPDFPYEIVNGEIKELIPMGACEAVLASKLDQTVGNHAAANRLGLSTAETLFRFPRGGAQRRPDVAFVSIDRWNPRRRVPKGPAWEMVPDLAIEVVSPSDFGVDVLDKMREYFDAGVRQVWFVWPNIEQVHVYTSMTDVRIVPRDGVLTGGDVLPGFTLPLAELFPAETE